MDHNTVLDVGHQNDKPACGNKKTPSLVTGGLISYLKAFQVGDAERQKALFDTGCLAQGLRTSRVQVQ